MRKILLATLGVLIVLGSGAYVFLIHPLLSPSEETPFAEAVLAKPDVVLLTGLNVRQMAFLERWFLGGPIVPVAEDVSGRTPQDRTLVDHLRAVSVEPRRDIDYALYALYPSDGGALRHAIMLVGRFSPGPINDYLARALGGVPRPGAGRISYEITIVDPSLIPPRFNRFRIVPLGEFRHCDQSSETRACLQISGAPGGRALPLACKAMY